MYSKSYDSSSTSSCAAGGGGATNGDGNNKCVEGSSNVSSLAATTLLDDPYFKQIQTKLNSFKSRRKLISDACDNILDDSTKRSEASSGVSHNWLKVVQDSKDKLRGSLVKKQDSKDKVVPQDDEEKVTMTPQGKKKSKVPQDEKKVTTPQDKKKVPQDNSPRASRSREQNRWKPVKHEQHASWMSGKTKSWRASHVHADKMKIQSKKNLDEYHPKIVKLPKAA